MEDPKNLKDLNNLFETLLAVSQGDVEALSRATKDFERDVTSPTNQIPRDSSTPTTSSPSETSQTEKAG